MAWRRRLLKEGRADPVSLLEYLANRQEPENGDYEPSRIAVQLHTLYWLLRPLREADPRFEEDWSTILLGRFDEVSTEVKLWRFIIWEDVQGALECLIRLVARSAPDTIRLDAGSGERE